MSKSRKRAAGSSRRTFLKTAAGVAAGTVLTRQAPVGARRAARRPSRAGRTVALTKIHSPFMITPDQAWDWHLFKAECGPTYAGSTGWKRFADFLIAKMPELGADRSRLRRGSLRPLHRGRLARSAHAHPRLRRRGRKARDRRDTGAGRGRLRHDVGLHAARGHHGQDAVLRSRQSAGGGRHGGQDSRVPDRAVPESAVHESVPRRLHDDRLRVALAGQLASALHAAADERHELVSHPLGLEPAWRLCLDRPQVQGRGPRRRLRPVAGRGVGVDAAQRLHRGRKGGTRRGLPQLPDVDARSRERREGPGGCEGGQDRDADADGALPARHGQGLHRVSAGQELRHAAGRADPRRDAHRRDVAD